MSIHSAPERKANRLISEKSPYLLQHAYNPVDWYPWSDEAFARAKEEDKPVFVSIGYSACHWCHVMEKESFEDPAVAELLNRVFVCVKVDREERPDIDAAYMAACQSMGRSCGWPLNVIITPSKNPFFVASYIPKDDRYSSVGLLNLVPQIEQVWKTRRIELEAMGTEIKEKISAKWAASGQETLGQKELDEAFDQLYLSFDHENAGFGDAPRFPQPHNLLFLLRYYNRTKQPSALSMVERTLRNMRLGGIFDQVGLGFHRYSTDAKWLVPHFEKMLYDQALIALAYLEAYQASGALKFMVSAKETLDYVLNELASPGGGFYSAEDADSEGEEGKYYLWTADEVKASLPVELADFAARIFDVRAEGNFFEPGKGRNCKNILHIAVSLEQMATEGDITVDQVIGKLAKTVALLNKARQKRVHPSKDTKVLVDWNGLAIAGLARAAQVLDNQNYLKAAEKAANFILTLMQTDKHRLFHRFADGESAIIGFLDDYAFLIYGLIELYEAGFDEKYLQAGVELAKVMINDFWDDENGGFYFTSQSRDEDIPRLKQSYDGAVPSGNSVALHDLLRLAALTGDVSFSGYADKLLMTFSEDIRGYPMGHTFMLSGLDYLLGPTTNVTVVGDLTEEDTKTMLTALRKQYLPSLTVMLWTQEKARSAPRGVSYNKIGEKATAYVCTNQTCMPPTSDIQQMLKHITTPIPQETMHKP
ncbi:thioredoxin domain-containing protein [Candidatus Bathyarchaeota archaeon]|nr:thioredoxin domain-containing protein [Candidatus Bathyarchaeota archaeon]